MPFGRTSESRDRIEANNKVEIPNGTREFEIVDAWLYNVVEESAVSKNGREYTSRKYTADLTNDQDCELKLRLVKRPDIVIKDTLRVYLGKKSRFAKLMEDLNIAEPGDELESYLMAGKSSLDAKATSKQLRGDLVGRRVLCSTEYKPDTGYVRVSGYTAKPMDDEDDLATIPVRAAVNAAPQSDPNPFDDDEIPF